MTEHVQDTAERRAPDGHFSEGLDDRRRFPEDERVGRFSKGQERLALDEEKDRQGASAWGGGARRGRSGEARRAPLQRGRRARALPRGRRARGRMTTPAPGHTAGRPLDTGQRHGDVGGCAHLERYYREARLDDPPGDASCHSVPLPPGATAGLSRCPHAYTTRRPASAGPESRRAPACRPAPRWNPSALGEPAESRGERGLTPMLPERAGRATPIVGMPTASVRRPFLRPSVALALRMARKNTTTPAIPTFQAACCDSASVNAETNSHAPISALIQLRMLAAHAPAARMAASKS